jgi:hypothetical protein
MSGKTTATRNTKRARVGSTARLAAAMNLNKKSLASGSIIEQYEKNNASRKERQNKRSNLASALTLSTANIGERNAKAIKRRANALKSGSTEEYQRLNAENAEAKATHKKLEEEYKNLSDSLAKYMREFDEKFDTTLMKANLLGLKEEYENNKDKNNEQGTKQLQIYLTRSIESFKLYIQRNPTMGSKVKEVLFKMLSSGIIDKNDISDPKVKELILFIIPLLKILRPFIFRVLPYSDDFDKYSKIIDDLSEQAEAIENGNMKGGYTIDITPDNIKKFHMFRYGKDQVLKQESPLMFIIILFNTLLIVFVPWFVALIIFCNTTLPIIPLMAGTDSSMISTIKTDWVKQKIAEIKKKRGNIDEAQVRIEIINNFREWKKENQKSYKESVKKGKLFLDELKREKEEEKTINPAYSPGRTNPPTTQPLTPTKILGAFELWGAKNPNKLDALFNRINDIKNSQIRNEMKGKVQTIFGKLKERQGVLTGDNIQLFVKEIGDNLEHLITYKNPSILNDTSHLNRVYSTTVEPKLNQIITKLQ